MTTWRVRLRDTEGRQHDVRIEGDPGASTAAMRPAVRRLGIRGSPIRLRGRDLTSWSTMAETGLLHGELLCCGEPYAGQASPRSESQPILSAGRHLVVVAGPDAGLVVPLGPGATTIGRSRSADVSIADPELSAIHAEIDVGCTAIVLRDAGSSNGTWLEGRRLGIDESAPLTDGDYVAVGSTLCTIVDFEPTDVAVLDHRGSPNATLQRHFRPALESLPDHLAPPRPPPRRQPGAPSWWRPLTPLITGIGFALLTGRWEFLLLTALAPLMFFFDTRRARSQQAEQWEDELSIHEAELTDFWTMVTRLRSVEAHRRRDRAAIGGMALARILLPHRRLWERQPTDPDFLHLDIGLAPLPVEMTTDDNPTPSPPLHWNVPLEASLNDLGSIAVVGPASRTRATLRGFVLGLGSTHAPGDLRLWFFCTPEAAVDWTFVRWLPHAVDELGRARLASTPSEVADRVAQLTRPIEDDKRQHRPGTGRQPVDVLIIDQGAAPASPALAELVRNGPSRSVFSVVSDAVVAPDGTGGRLDLRTGDHASFRSTQQPRLDDVRVAEVSTDWARSAALALAPLRTGDAGLDSVDTSPRLVDLLGVDHLDPQTIRRRWQRQGPTTAAIVGTTGGAPMSIDIAKHGPHGLVGGMSGSGKTELLMTLLASLCIQNHPDDLAVAIVDFKGGVDHGLTSRLPHVVSLSTNLDTSDFARTIALLDAEQRRRQALFNGIGSDLNAYRAAAATRPELPKMPRLLVVVDEFSELLASEDGKEHLNELIRVTRIGRALGVHLLLVTQNFEGQLPTQIEANAGLRVCLRVMKAGHSKVVLGTGAAADLDERHPGRAIARLNGRELVEFQTARVTGQRADLNRTQRPPDAAIEIGWLASRVGTKAVHTLGNGPDRGFPLGETDMHAIVATLADAARASGWTASAVPWPDPLPSEVMLTDLENPCQTESMPGSVSIPFGLEDRPDEQRQCTSSISSTDGDILLLGGPDSGLNRTLETLAVSAASVTSPDRLHIHLIDLEGGRLADLTTLPHVGTAATRDDRLALRLIRHLDALVAERRLARQLDAEGSEHRSHQLVLVSGADRLVRRGENRHPLLDPLMELMLDSSSFGVQFVLAGLPALGESRLTATFDRRLVFRGAGASHSAGLGDARPLVRFLDRPGRALDTRRSRLIQVATVGPDVAATAHRLDELHHEITPEHRARRLRSVDWPLAAAAVDVGSPPERFRRPFPLAVQSDSGQVYWVDAAEEGPMVVVTGPAKSGRTSALVGAAFLATQTGWSCVAVSGSRRSVLATDHGTDAMRGVFRDVVHPTRLGAALSARVDHVASDERTPPPLAVFLDDCHRLSLDDIDSDQLLTSADVIVMAGPMDFVAGRAPFRRAFPDHEVGVLLNPSNALDGQAVGLPGRLPEDARSGRRPGQGLAVVAGEATAVTMPLHKLQAARA